MKKLNPRAWLIAGAMTALAAPAWAQSNLEPTPTLPDVAPAPADPVEKIVTAGGACTTVFDCNDLNPCTLDACDMGTCTHTAGPDCAVNFTPGGGQVNVSGATLFVDYFLLPAQTNDWINPDNDFDCYSAGNPFSGMADCGISGDTFDTGPGPNCAYRGFVDNRSTNCNQDGSIGGGMIDSDQLAPAYANRVAPHFLFHYRSVGSIEGYQEFIDFQICGDIPTSIPSERGIVNRNQYAQNGAILANGFSDCLASGSPICPDSVDLGLTDVNGPWVVRGGNGSLADWNAKPATAGYGLYPYEPAFAPGYLPQLARLFKDCNGDMTIQPNEQLNIDVDTPNSQTVFDIEIGWGPICYIVNRGVGAKDADSLPMTGSMTCIDTAGNLVACAAENREGDMLLTDIRHLMVLGRTRNGENLVGATRDVGSGTRNGVCNTTGIDPSWCNGDNRGPRINSATPANLGLGHQATNCGSSGIIETAVQNRRLAIGFTGVSGPSRAASDARAGRYEILNIRFDDERQDGDADPGSYVRPTIDAILSNGDPDTGWTLGGEISFSSKGNPHHNNIPRDDLAVVGGLFPMANVNAAQYFVNILQSIIDFAGSPNDPDNFGMPADGLIRRFFLTAGIDELPKLFDPLDYQPNTGLLPSVKLYARCNNELSEPAGRLPGACPGGSSGGLDMPSYGVANRAGLSPTRNSAIYQDTNGVAGTAYRYSNGSIGGSATLGAGQRLGSRNKVQGDWNNDGERDIDDFPRMMAWINKIEDEFAANPGDPTLAWQNVIDFELTNHAGDAGQQTGGNRIIPQVIGDHDGNGNFDSADVRYAADGLALVTSAGAGGEGEVLNRKTGFTLVDTEWATLNPGDNNYFNTMLVNGTYDPGDSRADIAGAMGGTAPNAEPVGSDGIVDDKDIDYVLRQFVGFTGDQVVWNDPMNPIDSAINPTTKRIADLSADITGDLIIDIDDVTELVEVILETNFGDADLNGDVDCVDLATYFANVNLTGKGWADGDFTGDGLVSILDLAYLQQNLPCNLMCPMQPPCPMGTVCNAMTGICEVGGFACTTASDCRNDPDNNGCNCAQCPAGFCAYTCAKFGNVNCDALQLVNLDDILCVLGGFASFGNCPDGDVSPCGGNGIINLDDILSVLAAFSGANQCMCNQVASAPLCGSISP